MKNALPWIAATAVVALMAHVFALEATPFLINRAWAERLEHDGLRPNVLAHARRAKPAGQDIVGYDNPDNVSSFMLFDVSNRPVRLHLRVVREAVYWSTAFVADDTGVFHLIRDSDVSGDVIDVVLVGPHGAYRPAPGERVVRAPTDRGSVVMRMIVPDRSDAETIARLAAIKSEGRCEVVAAR